MDTRKKEGAQAPIDAEKAKSTSNPQPAVIHGWEGSRPTKPFFSLPVKSYKLLGDDQNVECHDHAPRDKCDSSCRFFDSSLKKTETADAPTSSDSTEQKVSPVVDLMPAKNKKYNE